MLPTGVLPAALQTRPTVLVVDDEPGIVQALQAAMARKMPEADVKTAATAEEAIALLQTARVDLVVSDHYMPGMQGVDLLTWARRSSPHAALVLMTAHPDVDVLTRGTNDARVDRVLLKPFTLEHAVGTVRDLLDAQRAERQRHLAFARALDATRRRIQETGSDA